MGGVSIGGVIYLIIGVLVANSHGYFMTINTLPGLISAILAVLLWPLVILGASLHLAF
jgi:hypothetical protein